MADATDQGVIRDLESSGFGLAGHPPRLPSIMAGLVRAFTHNMTDWVTWGVTRSMSETWRLDSTIQPTRRRSIRAAALSRTDATATGRSESFPGTIRLRCSGVAARRLGN